MNDLKCLFLLLGLLCAASPDASSSEISSLELQLQEYVSDKDARIGIAVIIDGCDTVGVNATRDFPMLSVYKFPQALAVVDYCRKNNILLTDSIDIQAGEIKENTWSPMRDRYGVGYISLPIAELLDFTLTMSDNNACDVLFRMTGGPHVTDSLMKQIGFPGITVASTEDEMHRDIYLCYLNRSTPIDMARLFDKFNTELSHQSPDYEYIARLLEGCTTGTDRLAVPLRSASVVFGHKTGTGDRNSQNRIIAVNDCGYVNFPDGHRYSIAVFVADSAYDMDETSAIIADISKKIITFVENDFRRGGSKNQSPSETEGH